MAPTQNGGDGVFGVDAFPPLSSGGNGSLSRGSWVVGLVNSRHKYLTAETFGFKINANGTSMRKKQMWILEPFGPNDPEGGASVALRSHLGCYLAVDQFGNVTCDTEADDKGEAARFEISVPDGSDGRWALRNSVRGYYLGAVEDNIMCEAKSPGEAEFWTVHLAARPMVNLWSVGRKRFASVSEDGNEIRMDVNVAWGPGTLFTLEFRPETLKYAVLACNDKYLSKDGQLLPEVGKDCLFSAEFHQGFLALRDSGGLYLGPVGPHAALKTRSMTATKDELFQQEDSTPQASFISELNSRYVSVKQGIEVTANQEDASDNETFRLEFESNTKRWYVRTMQDKFWTLEVGGGIQAVADKRSSNALFELTWGDGGSVTLRANNGKYVTTKKSGQLCANADSPTKDNNARFYFELASRPVMALKCDQGFVGTKSGNSDVLDCNKATYDAIVVERGAKGLVYFKGKNGKYWSIGSSEMTVDAEDPSVGFYLELVKPSRLRIKTATGGYYLESGKNGALFVGGGDPGTATVWEY